LISSYAVATPSRGLIHSRTVEAVARESADTPGFTGWAITHDLPIPLAHEQAVASAIGRWLPEAVIMVEEDVIPPEGSFGALLLALEAGADVAGVDYPVGEDWGCAVRDEAGAVLWVGTGLAALSVPALERLERPWFRTDRRWLRGPDGGWHDVPAAPDERDRFGQQDIELCRRVREAGGRVSVVPGMTAAHAQVRGMGRQGSNVGWHDVRLRTEIREQYPGDRG